MNQKARDSILQVLRGADHAHHQFNQSKDPFDGLIYQMSVARIGIRFVTAELEEALEKRVDDRKVSS